MAIQLVLLWLEHQMEQVLALQQWEHAWLVHYSAHLLVLQLVH